MPSSIPHRHFRSWRDLKRQTDHARTLATLRKTSEVIAKTLVIISSFTLFLVILPLVLLTIFL